MSYILIKGRKDGTDPITRPAEPLQVLSMKHPKGKKLSMHYHEHKVRVTECLHEAIVVISGHIRVDMLPDEQVELTAGDCIIIQDVPVGIEMLADSEFYEFKNGPFIVDKVIL